MVTGDLVTVTAGTARSCPGIVRARVGCAWLVEVLRPRWFATPTRDLVASLEVYRADEIEARS